MSSLGLEWGEEYSWRGQHHVQRPWGRSRDRPFEGQKENQNWNAECEGDSSRS